MYLTELLSRAVNAGKPSLVHPVTLKAVDISPCSGSQIKVGCAKQLPKDVGSYPFICKTVVRRQRLANCGAEVHLPRPIPRFPDYKPESKTRLVSIALSTFVGILNDFSLLIGWERVPLAIRVALGV